MYNILTRETSIVSITLLGSIFRINEKTASLISARISCSLEAPAFITAAKTCKSTMAPIKFLTYEPANIWRPIPNSDTCLVTNIIYCSILSSVVE